MSLATNFDLGKIKPPAGTFLEQSVSSGGLIKFLSNLLNLVITLAGLFVLFNFVLAGYGYLSASNDPQKISAAGNKILQSIIGLVVVAASFVIAGIIGQVLFGDPAALIKPQFFGIK
jgi:hypothetical protein